MEVGGCRKGGGALNLYSTGQHWHQMYMKKKNQWEIEAPLRAKIDWFLSSVFHSKTAKVSIWQSTILNASSTLPLARL